MSRAPRRANTTEGASLFVELEPRTRRFEARVLAGIDEAGFGPMLGPLTLGFAALRAERCAHDEPWRRLAALVAREPLAREERLVVNDSKVVFSRDPRGRARLERTVLAFDALRHGSCAPTAREFLARADPLHASARLASEPWCGATWSHLANGPESVATVVAELRTACASASLDLADLGARAVPVADLNASFERTQSKARTLWDEFAPLLQHLWRRFGADGLEVVVDRHGGRMRYAPLLRETFPTARVEIERETAERSEYALFDAEGRAMRLVFAEKAETHSFCVALASCCAKYARELCMEAFNAHFTALDPTLRPTAGYYNDGVRWLEEAATALARAGLSRAALARSR